MAKKNFDRDSRDVFGLKAREALHEETANHSVQAQTEQAAPVARAQQAEQGQAEAPAQGGEKLIQRSYYITPALEKAIRMRIATSDRPEDRDKSSIVRAALERYLLQP